MRRSADLQAERPEEPTWWREAIFYQVYLRSFADHDGDGIGDLAGLRHRLGYLELLGVDAVWLTPFYSSPMAELGQDITDPRGIAPEYGDLTAFDALVDEAREHGIRILVSLVPNHTSDEHPWFLAGLSAGPGSPQRGRYVFQDGRGYGGTEPPNNWTNVTGGPAWTQVPDGQWYLHLHSATQPDLSWGHPDVQADLEETLRFWLDRGVDGFGIGLAHGLAKPAGLPDMDPRLARRPEWLPVEPEDPRFDDDTVHDVHRLIRKVLDERPGRIAVGDILLADDRRYARYLRADELHIATNPRLRVTEFDADLTRLAIERSLTSVASVGKLPSWSLSGPDLVRHVSRYGGGDVGQARARAMALVLLALPGPVFLYNGEELGLPNVELPDWALRDPVWERSGRTERGKDSTRIPMPWEGTEPPFGFTTGRDGWLPMPYEWSPLSVEAQLEDSGSMLSLYRHALELRHSHPAFQGDELEWYGAPPGCFAFRRKGGRLICALNTSGALVPLPGGDVLASSAPLQDGQLPPDTSVWLY
ncbi:MAG TPA: alpha-amylase family glycosyl hydrolase [Pseudonocardiaceae bacterium]|nr:alpha-amylase family glycosyl hydrolase [Pseudonocardiaceae bacterium]